MSAIEFDSNKHYIFATPTGQKIVSKETGKVLLHIGTEAEIAAHAAAAKKAAEDKEDKGGK